MKKNELIKAIVINGTSVALLVAMLAGCIPNTNHPTESTPGNSSTPTQTQPTVTDPTVTDPTVTDPTVTDPTVTDPTVTDPTVTDPTDPPPTETDPTDPPPTDPVGNNYYSREELENFSKEAHGFGPGRTSGGARPKYPQQDQAKYGQYGADFIGPDNNKIYLTFDCGYEYFATDASGNKYAVTARILDVLKEKNVQAVFFVTGNYVKKNPELIRRMIDEGHIVGNHTSTHPSMPNISIEEMVAQVMEVHDYMLEHYDYEMTLFRAPAGEYSIQSLAVVRNLGYKHLFWSFAYGDYDPDDQPEHDYAYDLITRNHHNGAIYLLHAISVTNAEVLGDCIDFWRAEGYQIELYP